MRRLVLTACILLLLSPPLHAANRRLTCYLDGSVLRQEILTSKGYAEVSLSGAMMPGALRVKPGNETVIIRVQVVPAKANPKLEKALASLDEHRELLGDRLRALQTREEIFVAAARSQSAKAPRKSKNNPEPVTAIKQGTDLALARLEEVYRLRRAAEMELKSLEVKRVDMARKANVGGSVARIWLQGKSGVVSVEYAAVDAAWKPVYDLRMDETGSSAAVTIRALLPETEQGTIIAVTPARLNAPSPSVILPAGGDYAPVATYTLPVVVSASVSPISRLSLTLTNTTQMTLPAGDASCFWKGEFRGTTHLNDLAPGERKELVCGRPPEAAASDTGR